MDEPISDRASIPSAVFVGTMEKPALLQALRAHKVQLNQAAENLFDDFRFTCLSQKHVIEIIPLSVAELGFSEGATYGQLTAKAFESGLAECPLELAPYLRMQFLEQPEGAVEISLTHGLAPPGSITVASSPLDDRDHTPKGFYLRRVVGVLWLRGYWSSSSYVWNPQDVFVFSRGCKAV